MSAASCGNITGLAWLEKPERSARLHECAEVIQSLLADEEVTNHSRVRVVNAKLYSRPPATGGNGFDAVEPSASTPCTDGAHRGRTGTEPVRCNAKAVRKCSTQHIPIVRSAVGRGRDCLIRLMAPSPGPGCRARDKEQVRCKASAAAIAPIHR